MTRSKSGFKGDPDWKAQARKDGVLKYPFALSTNFSKFCRRDYLINLLLSIAVDEVSGNYILLVNLGTGCELRGPYQGETELSNPGECLPRLV